MYPDSNERFDIHMDANNYQLGAGIIPNVKSIAFYSRKLKGLQTQYTVTEKELLSIVETLKESCTILLGPQLKIYIDHKNITFKKINTDRVLRRRLILE